MWGTISVRIRSKLACFLEITPSWGTHNGVHLRLFNAFGWSIGSRTTCSVGRRTGLARLTAETAPGARTGRQRQASRALRPRPGGLRRVFTFPLLCCEFLEHAREHGGNRRQIHGIGISRNDSDVRLDALVCGRAAHSGMFPCFFGGCTARFVRSARNPLITAIRVAAGSMMPSSSPRSAARNGDATL